MAGLKVSFARICYEQEEYIREAVRSALAQDYQPLEIILSDDCSLDSTFDIIEEEASQYSGSHTIITNRNESNLGIEHIDKVMELARGDFVVIAHGDDRSSPHRTQRLVDAWLRGNFSLVSSNAMIIDETGSLIGPLCKVGENRPVTRTEIIRIPWQSTRLGATFAFDREIFSRFQPIDRRIVSCADDHILPFRAALLNGMYFLAEPLVEWRRHRRNWGDRISNKVSSKLVLNETNAAYDIGAMIHMLEELGRFTEENGASPSMINVNRELVTAIVKHTQYWTRLRNTLVQNDQRPTWVPKQELDEIPIVDEFRVQPNS